MIVIDTNILLRASLNDDPVQSRIAQEYLAQNEKIVIPLHALCEFVWVMSRSYRLRRENITSSILDLVKSRKVICDREAVAAGLAFFLDGGDFADGVIEHDGRKLGGEIFATFDKQAASIINAKGRIALLLSAD